MSKLRIFISSRAADNSQWRDAAAEACAQAGHEPVRLPEGQTKDRHKKDYMGQLASCQIVLYLVDEPSDAVEEEVAGALADGKPVIMLTPRKRTADGDQILTDYAKKLRKEGPVMIYPFDDLAHLRTLVQTTVETVIERRFREPGRPIGWGGGIYRKTVDSMREVNSRFAFAQETSSLILGPDRRRPSDEADFLRVFYDLAGNLEANPELEILHVFDLEATALAISEEPENYPAMARWSKRLFDTIAADTSGRLHIGGVPPRLSPVMIADETIMLGHHIGPQSRRGSFHMEVGEWAADTWGHLKAAIESEGRDVREFLEEQGLVTR